MEDTVAMQREAEQRVRRMHEQLQALAGAPTFGAPPAKEPEKPAKGKNDLLPLLLFLWLLQDGGEHAPLILLAYLLF